MLSVRELASCFAHKVLICEEDTLGTVNLDVVFGGNAAVDGVGLG
jgi:hypothetical protein